MQVVKTVKIPVHYATTKHKLHILNSLTARTTYGVYLWSQLIEKNDLKATFTDRAMFHQEIKRENRFALSFRSMLF